MTKPELPQTDSKWKSIAAAAATPICLWLAQPPLGWWPLVCVALLPWFVLASRSSLGWRGYGTLGLFAALYWLVSLQGLRHAHPLMALPWLMLGAYLAVYHVLFVAILHRLASHRQWWIAVAPIAWVAMECARNYLLTGISVLMFGHFVVDVPALIQVADLFGTYGVSFLVVLLNVAAWEAGLTVQRRSLTPASVLSVVVALGTTVAAIVYGRARIEQGFGDQLATFALIQRSEPVEYGQPIERDSEIFQRYAQQAMSAVAGAPRAVDAVVWPESMFTGGVPWRIVEDDFIVPDESGLSRAEFLRNVQDSRDYFLQRARYVQTSLSSVNVDSQRPELLVGCAVVRYGAQPVVHSGAVHIDAAGEVADWYGKTHLVVFGEYIPILPHIPGLRSWVPADLGVGVGPGPKKFAIGGTAVVPNICIETAVERVTVNHLHSFLNDPPAASSSIPEVIVTVTNDGWFDNSSVIEHHLRCAQLLAVAVRRPILSAANNGPTAWVDSCGQVVQRLPQGASGAVIATPRQDQRISLYLRIGDWPARCCLIAVAGMMLLPRRKGLDASATAR